MHTKDPTAQALAEASGDHSAISLHNRRAMLRFLLGGPAMLGLRSLASGIPLAVLANPRLAFAGGDTSAGATCLPSAQYLIFSSSAGGDPVNTSVPGTYLADPNISRSLDPAMAPTVMTVGGQAVTAAKPWANLPQTLLNRTCFFHHATGTSQHGDELKVLDVMGATSKGEMFISLLSSQLAACLGTVQPQPISLGGYPIFYQSLSQPMLTPMSLASILSVPNSPLTNLQKMRDQDVDNLNAFFNSQGTPAQKTFLDQWAQSQSQTRQISQNLFSSLAAIADNGAASQMQAAVILIQMKASPVIAIQIPFGGDNHSDPNFAYETAQTVSGVETIGFMYQQLLSANIQDEVTFAMMNVFGRTFCGPGGRTHNANHHCTIMMGKHLSSSIIGGITQVDGDYGALAINPTTGVGDAGASLGVSSGLASAAVTLGAAVGVSDAFLSANISGGQKVSAALA